jgi:hypothetical protein
MAKWSALLGSTAIPALVMPRMPPFVMSLTATVWVPTVASVTPKEA